ncbi:chemotaxis protein CheW [Lachnospiraceae bacterium]|jgi:purine-binding chemotaxis protein CheW|nr:purine-binding chemotaxis protein CheW [Lachnospiraceae bacterium]GFI64715.1 chemotaxis protein CheW [Lachnospiraceae bacterium]
MELGTNAVRNLADEEENKNAVESIQFIVIRLGDEQYGIDIRMIDNITKMQAITRIPKMPAYLKGVINMRGDVIPVISIRLKMGLPADEITKSTRIIVLKLEQEGMVGLIVDEVKEVVTLFTNEIEKIAYNAKDEKANLINAVGKHNGELISLFDLSAISLEGN